MLWLSLVLFNAPPTVEATAERIVVTASEKPGPVSVVPAKGREPTPMLGEWTTRASSFTFTPRFPFEPGVAYQVVVGSETLRFSLPAKATTPGRVTDVFPKADKLPANTLRFYVHFDQPMRQGQGYEHFQLLDRAKKPVPSPFLILDEELWSDDGQRFTLYFDPGRVKQELVPRKELGPVLVVGQSYTLVIRKSFKTADGQPMTADFNKSFTAVANADTALDPEQWKIVSPAAQSKDAVEIRFDRLLDHALLRRVITVENSIGTPVAGAVKASDDDTRWQWAPEKPWVAGEYRIVIQGVLEDVCGNRIGAAFDTKLGDIGARALKPPTKLRFLVK